MIKINANYSFKHKINIECYLTISEELDYEPVVLLSKRIFDVIKEGDFNFLTDVYIDIVDLYDINTHKIRNVTLILSGKEKDIAKLKLML